MEKIKNIEFLRVVGCLAIVLLHLFLKSMLGSFQDVGLYRQMYEFTSYGSKAVDLFFIISGLFFAYTINTDQSFSEFVKKKLVRLYPVFLCIIVLYFIFSLFGTMKFALEDNILTLLLLNGTAIVIKSGNAQHVWYVSAMFWVILLYFYLLKCFDKKIVNLLVSLVILFSYSFLIHTQNGGIGGIHNTYYNFINLGLLRALGGIGIGYFIGEWYKSNVDKIKSWNPNIYSVIVLSLLEIIILYFIITNFLFHSFKYNNQFIYIVLYASIIILFLIKKGIFSKMLDYNIWRSMAKYTYSIYLIHFPILSHLRFGLWKHNPEIIYEYPMLNVIAAIFIVIVAGILCYHFVEKPCLEYYRKRKAENITN